MNKVEMLTKFNTKVNKMKIRGRKYSPEILLLLGMAGAITGTVLACIATTKLDTVKDELEDDLADIHERLDLSDGETGSDNTQELKKETTMVYVKSGLRYAKLYAPAVIISGLSLSCMVASNVILRKRIIGVTAAYATVAANFKDYRSRVVDRYGNEIDKELRYNIQKKEVTTEYIDAKGKTKTKTEKVKVIDPNAIGNTARIYDDGCFGWSKDPQTNLNFLKCQESAANQILMSTGKLFLNDVYKMLGFPMTAEGQVCGWIYNEKEPIGDNFVDFGIYDITNEKARDFVNGYERNILLDFNIDGRILELI